MIHVTYTLFADAGALRATHLVAYALCTLSLSLFLTPHKLLKVWRSVLRYRALTALMFWTQVCLPALAFLLSRVIKIDSPTLLGLVLVAVCPMSPEGPLMALWSSRGDAALGATATALSMVMGFGTISLASFWTETSFPTEKNSALHVPGGDIGLSALCCIAPLALGAAITHKLGPDRHNFTRRVVGIVIGVLAFIAVVVLKILVIVDNIGSFKWSNAWTVSIAYALVSFVAPYIIGTILRVKPRARMAMAFSGGRQAVTLAVFIRSYLVESTSGTVLARVDLVSCVCTVLVATAVKLMNWWHPDAKEEEKMKRKKREAERGSDISDDDGELEKGTKKLLEAQPDKSKASAPGSDLPPLGARQESEPSLKGQMQRDRSRSMPSSKPRSASRSRQHSFSRGKKVSPEPEADGLSTHPTSPGAGTNNVVTVAVRPEQSKIDLQLSMMASGKRTESLDMIDAKDLPTTISPLTQSKNDDHPLLPSAKSGSSKSGIILPGLSDASANARRRQNMLTESLPGSIEEHPAEAHEASVPTPKLRSSRGEENTIQADIIAAESRPPESVEHAETAGVAAAAAAAIADLVPAADHMQPEAEGHGDHEAAEAHSQAPQVQVVEPDVPATPSAVRPEVPIGRTSSPAASEEGPDSGRLDTGRLTRRQKLPPLTHVPSPRPM
eukprot:m51a1_g13963 hypothetical protein (670) ;mRNA; r:964676-966845